MELWWRNARWLAAITLVSLQALAVILAVRAVFFEAIPEVAAGVFALAVLAELGVLVTAGVLLFPRVIQAVRTRMHHE